MRGLLSELNVAAECRAQHLGIWQCPPFLFTLLGLATLAAMTASYAVASRAVEEPEIAALIVSFVAVVFFIVGNLIVSGFNAIVEATRTKSEFLSVVSHQLAAPLSVLRMTIGLIQQNEARGAAAPSAQDVKTLADTTENMVSLVRALVEASRIENRELTLRKETFSLDEMTRSTADMLRAYAAAHHVTIWVDAPAPVRIVADRDRIRMAVQNLMDNAIQYSPSGGAVTVSVRADGGYARWRIRDQGAGMPYAAQKHIFKKFFRAETSSRTNPRGSGLGLYIARGVVTGSGGQIGFTSVEGKGSEFWFTLPLAPVSV